MRAALAEDAVRGQLELVRATAQASILVDFPDLNGLLDRP